MAGGLHWHGRSATLVPGVPPGLTLHIGGIMYEKPILERFGTFRELTLLGLDAGSDLFSGFGIPGCDASPDAAGFEQCDDRY